MGSEKLRVNPKLIWVQAMRRKWVVLAKGNRDVRD
jgi:hypothetical protein